MCFITRVTLIFRKKEIEAGWQIRTGNTNMVLTTLINGYTVGGFKGLKILFVLMHAPLIIY